MKASDGRDQEHMAEKSSLHELGGRKERREGGTKGERKRERERICP